MLALPGTVQGQSGWYQQDSIVAKFEVREGDFTMLEGPIPELEYRRSLKRDSILGLSGWTAMGSEPDKLGDLAEAKKGVSTHFDNEGPLNAGLQREYGVGLNSIMPVQSAASATVEKAVTATANGIRRTGSDLQRVVRSVLHLQRMARGHSGRLSVYTRPRCELPTVKGEC